MATNGKPYAGRTGVTFDWKEARRAIEESRQEKGLPPFPLLKVACAICGIVEESVPLPLVSSVRDEHERGVHPEIFQRRLELHKELAELDQRLWKSSIPSCPPTPPHPRRQGDLPPLQQSPSERPPNDAPS